jgi:hypothetical protein
MRRTDASGALGRVVAEHHAGVDSRERQHAEGAAVGARRVVTAQVDHAVPQRVDPLDQQAVRHAWIHRDGQIPGSRPPAGSHRDQPVTRFEGGGHAAPRDDQMANAPADRGGRNASGRQQRREDPCAVAALG